MPTVLAEGLYLPLQLLLLVDLLVELLRVLGVLLLHNLHWTTHTLYYLLTLYSDLFGLLLHSALSILSLSRETTQYILIRLRINFLHLWGELLLLMLNWLKELDLYIIHTQYIFNYLVLELDNRVA
jgi:hypothetical protein